MALIHGPSLANEYNLLLSQSVVLGYALPSLKTQRAGARLIYDLKTAGLWNQIDIFYVFNTDNSNFSKLNWKNPILTCSLVGPPSFTAKNGFTGNGSTYINTNWRPGLDGVSYTLINACIFASFSGQIGATSRADLGTAGSFAVDFVTRITGDVARGLMHDGNLFSTTNTSSFGFYHNFRTAVTGSSRRIYRNGVDIGGFGGGNTQAITTQSIYLLGANSNGSLTGGSTNTINCFGAGSSLSGSEALLYTIWNRYETSM
jgi:hypothetical protein